MFEKTILLHGALGSAKQMQPLAERLGVDSICIDLPGHGSLAADGNLYSIPAMGETVLKHLEGPTQLIGFSMGGYVALHLAALYPEKVSRVVTIATKFAWSVESVEKEIRMLDPDKVKEKVPAFANLLAARHGPLWPEVMRRTSSLMLNLGNEPVLTPNILGKIQCPVMLLRGSEDDMVTKEESIWAQWFILNARYMELEGQAHALEKMDLEPLLEAIQT